MKHPVHLCVTLFKFKSISEDIMTTNETKSVTQKLFSFLKLRKKIVIATLSTILCIFTLGILTASYCDKVAGPLYYESCTSMFPTVGWDGYFWVNKRAYRKSEPERGDLVVTVRTLVGSKDDFVTEQYPQYMLQYQGSLFPAEHGYLKPRLVRRIIGLPGETIEIIDRKVHINGKPYWDPTTISGLRDIISSDALETYEGELDDIELKYFKHHVLLDNMKSLTIPAWHYFIMGDNRDGSLDSRHFGTVTKEDIYGKITNILFSRIRKDIIFIEHIIK